MKKTILGLTALAVAIPAMSVPASAQHYRGDYGRYDQRYDHRGDYRDNGRYYDNRGYYNGPTWRGRNGQQYCRRSDGSTGLLIGAVGGALVGRSIDTRGDRTAGTLLGAVVGGLLGNAIERDGNRGQRCR